ncbi:MAG: histidine phosphatase family protein [Pseudonocardiales bacterium]|nr:histidine phosphatase family protein [Pseudonocardiales bacterium]
MSMQLILVRHGESTANVAREQAEADRAEVIPVEARDADVPLSTLGEEQAVAVGRWLASETETESLRYGFTSPYSRALRTGQLVMEQFPQVDLVTDERLRDKEMGVLDTLTLHGVRTRFPEEWERRRWLGKFYYRAPGGESWADMALRIRSFLRDLPDDGDTVVFTHDATIMLFRYVCERLDEAALLDLAQTNTIGNASITRLRRASGSWQMIDFNYQNHLKGVGGQDMRTEHGEDHDVRPR